MQKREQVKKQLLDKNKQHAAKLKAVVNEGLEKTQRVEKQKMEQKKAKQVKEKLEKAMMTGILSARKAEKDKERVKERLEKERDYAQQNAQQLKVLEEKEQELLANLQKTANNSKELFTRVKSVPYLFPYLYKLPASVKKSTSRNHFGYGEEPDNMERTTVISSRKTTTAATAAGGINKTFDARK